MTTPFAPGKWRAIIAAATCAVVAWAATPTTAAAATTATTAAPAAGQTGAKAVEVTLITGDRVLVSGASASVRPGPGRSKVRFASQLVDGHRYVIPADALALLRAGKVDKRLFDVTELGTLGGDGGKDLPLLVSYPKDSATGARSAVTAAGARVTRDIVGVDTLAVRADLAGRRSIWSTLTAGGATTRSLRPGIQKVWLDGKRKISLDVSVPRIGTPTAWQAGFDGAGVTVAVLDTGVDATHPDLAGRIAAAENFTAAPTADDEVGHGTHVASIIAGGAAASDGRFRGVAPGAKLISGKVCETEFCDDSAILAGMAWAAERAAVVNMSLGGTDTPEIDPLEQAVQDLTAQHDTLFVIASGNDGGFVPVSSPSTADAALSVGAVDREDRLADFSSRGPRVGDRAVKPEITAPGVEIVAAKAKNGFLGEPGPLDGYVALSGTSMATPHVAGAAAILTQQHPGWSARLRKNTLMGSARPTGGVSAYDQGAGRVDVARGITQTVTADEGSLGFGLQQWPHTDDQPVTRTVTYRNSGTAAVELSLAISGGPFTVAADRLTVPAGGTASTTVTADTRKDVPDGVLGEFLTATAPGGVRVSTPLGVEKERESYEVTVEVTKRDGTPSVDHVVSLVPLEEGLPSIDIFEPGPQRLRIPKGAYGVYAMVFEAEAATLLTDSKLVLDRPRAIDADARLGKPMRVTPPEPTARAALAAVSAQWRTPHYTADASLLGDSFDESYAAPLSASTDPAFVARVVGTFAHPGADESFRNSPYVFDLAYFNQGRMFAGLTKAPHRRELATVHNSFAVEAAGATGTKGNVAKHDVDGGGYFTSLPFDLPFRRVEYLSTGASFSGLFEQELPPTDDDLPFPETVTRHTAELPSLRAGATYRQQWNRAVFGPNVTQPSWSGDWVARQGDHLMVAVPLFGDGAGHPGASRTTQESSVLYRGDTKVGEGDLLEAPPAPATYRLERTATRGAPHVYSTEVSGSWTFRSGHVPGDRWQRLPVSTIRFSPALDDAHRAPAGVRFHLPVRVEHQPGSTAGPARRVTVEVSYDDGRTWQKAALRGSHDRWIATVDHPSGASFVSLRASAADRAGNTVTQTVIRAYGLR